MLIYFTADAKSGPVYQAPPFHFVIYGAVQIVSTLCPERIPDITDCNLKKDYQILIVFGTNIQQSVPYRDIHGMAVNSKQDRQGSRRVK